MKSEDNTLNPKPDIATLVSAAMPRRFADDRLLDSLSKLFLILVGSALIGLSAQIEVPWYPVPVTGQTLMILLIGMAYGPVLGAVTVVAYLLEGALGLPAFSGGKAGWPVLVGFTGGYLFGFIVAAFTVGMLAVRGMGRTITGTVIAMVLGNLVIYACGVAWLQSLIGLEKAIAGGVLPFLYGDMLKILIAAFAMPAAWRAVQKFTGK